MRINRLRLASPPLALPSLFLAVAATPASAYTVELVQFSSINRSENCQTLEGTGANETITMKALGEDGDEDRVEFTGNTRATLGPGGGCTVSGNNATCTLANSTRGITILGQGGTTRSPLPRCRRRPWLSRATMATTGSGPTNGGVVVVGFLSGSRASPATTW